MLFEVSIAERSSEKASEETAIPPGSAFLDHGH
jgi:hypothetical protein